MAWSFVLTDRSGRRLVELRRAASRKIGAAQRRSDTLTFELPAAAREALFVTGIDKVIVRGYDDSIRNPDGSLKPRFQGPIIGIDKSRQEGNSTVAVTAAGIEWRLLSRLVGISANLAGPHPGKSYGTALAPIDRGEILRQVWVDAGSESTGIAIGTITPSNNTFAGPYYYKPAAEVFSEMSSGLDGVDWRVRPVEPYKVGQNTVFGELDIGPALGSVRSGAIFEFGTGRSNVASFNHTVDANGLLNQAWALPPGFPDAATQPVVTTSDADSIADRGVYHGTVTTDLEVQDLRQQLINEHVRVRKTPTERIVFTPVRDLDPANVPLSERRTPRFGLDYDLGDIVTFRAVERLEVYDDEGQVTGHEPVTTVDALLRVYGVSIELDDGGVATPTLTLVDDGS